MISFLAILVTVFSFVAFINTGSAVWGLISIVVGLPTFLFVVIPRMIDYSEKS